MKIGIVFTGTGPILIMTTYDDFADEKFCRKMAQKGITKFMAFEVPENLCKQKYGLHYQIIMDDVKEDEDLRVLDYNGFNVFHNFPFDTWGEEYRHEE